MSHSLSVILVYEERLSLQDEKGASALSITLETKRAGAFAPFILQFFSRKTALGRIGRQRRCSAIVMVCKENEWRYMKCSVCSVCVYAKLYYLFLLNTVLPIYLFCALALQYCIVNIRSLLHDAFIFTTLTSHCASFCVIPFT